MNILFKTRVLKNKKRRVLLENLVLGLRMLWLRLTEKAFVSRFIHDMVILK